MHPACQPACCGDGIRRNDLEPGADAFEACDDGNRESGDGCSSVCSLERCGNGQVDAGEQCDDGNRGRRRLHERLLERSLRNNILWAQAEQCDDGNQDQPTCRTTAASLAAVTVRSGLGEKLATTGTKTPTAAATTARGALR